MGFWGHLIPIPPPPKQPRFRFWIIPPKNPRPGWGGGGWRVPSASFWGKFLGFRTICSHPLPCGRAAPKFGVLPRIQPGGGLLPTEGMWDSTPLPVLGRFLWISAHSCPFPCRCPLPAPQTSRFHPKPHPEGVSRPKGGGWGVGDVISGVPPPQIEDGNGVFRTSCRPSPSRAGSGAAPPPPAPRSPPGLGSGPAACAESSHAPCTPLARLH